jgi:hypothetical protein
MHQKSSRRSLDLYKLDSTKTVSLDEKSRSGHVFLTAADLSLLLARVPKYDGSSTTVLLPSPTPSQAWSGNYDRSSDADLVRLLDDCHVSQHHTGCQVSIGTIRLA